MSHMIPSMIDPESGKKSPAEAKVFAWLSRMTWGDAIVLYSLPLKEHIKNSFGEIDFVVLCEMGIMCIEVKGGTVERKDGVWLYTNRFGKVNKKHQGPYTQVQGNMKSLREYLIKHLPDNDFIKDVRVASCVITPDCVINADNDVEVIPQISFNSNMHESDLPSLFERSFDYWNVQKGFGGKKGLLKRQRERIATFLRGDFSFVPALSTILDQTDEQLNALTDEQLIIMRNMNVNDRLIVEGGAGTGKTMLAVEQCRRSSISGNRVLYLCYNKIISSFVRDIISNDNNCDNVDVHTFHSLLQNACNETTATIERDSDYFSKHLPEKFLARCAKDFKKYDQIIIDEGQDLMSMNAYMCINEMMKGGWEKGKWTVYLDSHQNIYGDDSEYMDVFNEIKHYSFYFPLTVNCRNTKQIAEGNFAITHIYKADICKTSGEEIKYNDYSSKAEEAQAVFREIRRLLAEGVRKKDIVILSYYTMDNPNCCLKDVPVPDDIGSVKCNVVNDFQKNKHIRYYTIHSFKGMESKAVIMIDIDSFSTADKILLNYVGMSRARTYLSFFYDKKLSNERQKRLLEYLLEKKQ